MIDYALERMGKIWAFKWYFQSEKPAPVPRKKRRSGKYEVASNINVSEKPINFPCFYLFTFNFEVENIPIETQSHGGKIE